MNQLQVKAHPQVQPLSNVMTVVGLVNGMIGGTILVLPIIGIQTGFIMTLIVCAGLGFLTYYTCYLIILHLGKAETITISILAHFKEDPKYLLLYNFLIWISFVTILPIYFKLICLQMDGLLGYQSNWVGPIVFIALIAAVILSRMYNFSEEVIGYGIISHILFILFLVWAQFSAPDGPKTVKPMGDPIKLIGVLITALSIHDFLAQNIVRNPNKKQYPKLVKYTFVIGVIAYTFIAYGCFAILNRTPMKSRPQTINDYFPAGGWQITIIQVVYIIHLFSSYPNFLLVSQASFFQMFNVKLKDKIQWKQICYICSFIFVAYLCFVLKFHLQAMIVIDGAVVGFTYIFMYPIWIHLKCVFYDKNSGFIEGDDQWNKQIQLNVCECNSTYSSKWTLYLQTLFLICLLIIGLLFIVFTIVQLVNDPNYNPQL